MSIIERLGAFIFLILMLGLVAFLTFVPMPAASEKVILIIIGGLMTESAKGVGKLVGGGVDTEKEDMKKRLRHLEAEYSVLKGNYDAITKMLIERHVVDGQGFIPPKQIEDKT